MLIVYKKCKECGEKFTPKSPKHDYHTRKCFMTAYRRKQREITFPYWTCPKCHEMIRLKFSPIKDALKWLTLECPNCKYCRLEESLELD